MRLDRWVVPPAVGAAVFAVLAVSPPIGWRPPSTHRLESLGAPEAGRPWLLRTRLGTSSRNASAPRVDSPDAVVERLSELPSQGAWYRVPVPQNATSLTVRIRDEAGVHLVRVPVQAARSVTTGYPSAESVMVVEGTLVPELRGEVIVRPAGDAANLLPVTDQVAVQPGRQTVDACGLVRFEVRVSGLGAPVSLVTATAAGELRAELRLPLVPGGIAVHDDVDAIVLRATSAGPIAHLVAGDRAGPSWWTAMPLGADGDEGSARVVLPSGARWVVASPSADLTEPVSPLIRPSGPPCLSTPLGRRLERGRSVPPPLPAPGVVWNGPIDDARLTGQRIRRARLLCAVGLGASVLLEALLLLGAGLARGPSALRPLDDRGRDRLGLLVAGISTLLLMGAALAIAVGLRGP